MYIHNAYLVRHKMLLRTRILTLELYLSTTVLFTLEMAEPILTLPFDNAASGLGQ